MFDGQVIRESARQDSEQVAKEMATAYKAKLLKGRDERIEQNGFDVSPNEVSKCPEWGEMGIC